jgi:CDP-glycerol glycerophosphotransferase (TagB/SpsB family)
MMPKANWIRRSIRLLEGFNNSIILNYLCAVDAVNKRKSIFFMVHSHTQLIHINSLVQLLSSTSRANKPSVYLLIPPIEVYKLQRVEGVRFVSIGSYLSVQFLVFWNAVIGVDQRMRYPYLSFRSKKARICMFHGQPTKCNVYLGYNHKNIDFLFMYGQFMKDYYDEQLSANKKWKSSKVIIVGQPKSDVLFKAPKKKDEKSIATFPFKLNGRNIVLYAPSYESCSSLSTNGQAIISRLIQEKDIYLIVKPHPAFYRTDDTNDTYFKGCPSIASHADSINVFTETNDNIFFSTDLDSYPSNLLQNTSVLITDYSGISFEACVIDIPVCFIHCDSFFRDYVPSLFGLPYEQAIISQYVNGGRLCGKVSYSAEQLASHVLAYIRDPSIDRKQRLLLSKQLLAFQGSSTSQFCKQLTTLIF